MKQKLNWQAYSSVDRNQIIEKIKDAISISDGYIMNFNVFSDIALSLSIEIKENAIKKLHNALSNILKVSDLDIENINLGSRKEWLIFINISFSNGTGNLKRKIPSVPG